MSFRNLNTPFITILSMAVKGVDLTILALSEQSESNSGDNKRIIIIKFCYIVPSKEDQDPRPFSEEHLCCLAGPCQVRERSCCKEVELLKYCLFKLGVIFIFSIKSR